MVNLIAVVGAVITVAAVALSAALLVTDEFAQAFVANGSGKFSCAIGYLGVYESGYDSSCLKASECQSSNLCSVVDGQIVGQTIDAFTSDTESFKLLFPSQQNFYYEVNPVYGFIEDCINTVPNPNPLFCNQGTLDTFFPSFESKDNDCDTYWQALSLSQPGAFNAARAPLDSQVFGSFISLTIEGILDSYFEGTLTGGLLSVIQEVGRGYLNGSAVATFGQEWEVSQVMSASDNAYAGSVSSIPFATSALTNTVALNSLFPSSIATALGVVGSALNAAPATCEGRTFALCAYLLLGGGTAADPVLQVNENFMSDPSEFSAAWCEAITGSTPCAPLSASITAYITFATQATTVSSNPALAQLLQGWNAMGGLIALFGNGLVPNSFNIADPYIIAAPWDNTPYLASSFNTSSAFAEQALADIGVNYPSTFGGHFAVCELLNAFQQISPVIQEAGNCSFATFLGNSIDIAVNAEASADLVNALAGVVTLFGSCAAAGIVDPAECWVFFPSFLINAAFSRGLQEALDSYTTGSSAVYDAAAESCKNDVKDNDAIGFAQVVAPIGISIMGVGAIAGFVAAGKPSKLTLAGAGVVCLIGTVILLSALLVVQQAPIYSAVTDDSEPESGDIVYKTGRSLTYGLAGIASGIIGSVVIFVSIFFVKSSVDLDSVKAGAAEVKSISI